ncbi:MAG: apolipoprotein N-acyltransferase [Pyrinomonadaceae bacterium]
MPTWKNALLAVLASVLLILAFPDFDLWFLAWFALVPLLWAIERERGHSCPHEHEVRKTLERLRARWGQECPRSFVLGWIFGTVFFFGTCWWLTYAPIHYAAFPPILAYFLLFCVTAIAGIFPGIFAALFSILLRRFGSIAFLAAPFVWVFTEFLRYWITGNNWNTVGYSQAFKPTMLQTVAIGGVYLLGFLVTIGSAIVAFLLVNSDRKSKLAKWISYTASLLALISLSRFFLSPKINEPENEPLRASQIVAVQPNVPMGGLTQQNWNEYRRNHIRLAESALASIKENPHSALRTPQLVIFPESPMNFMYEDDAETKEFINGFAAKNNVSVLFNSAEPDASNGKFFNSAVLVSPEGKEVVQYDKIYLLPFGEAVPFPLEGILPGFVGNFSYGKEYDLLPLGDAKAGVMICFESHFGQLSREYVRNGADVIIEMTNDGYLGPTPVLRQHLANAIFRAVETNRPVLRVTNVGITAYINERGEVLDAAEPYTEATRVWSVAKSDGSQTFYVKHGDWFAWLCTIITVGLLLLGFARRNAKARA